MELVYLWVEDYKNIQNQGFNFSPKFNCDYDEKTNKLTIDDNPNYIENFFGDNINVTAIVGKNGSGKSSVIEIISLLYFKAKIHSFSEKCNTWLLHYNQVKKEYSLQLFGGTSEPICIFVNGDVLEIKWINSVNVEQLLYQPSFDLLSSSWLSYLTKQIQDSYGSIYDLDGKPDDFNLFAFPSKKDRSIDIFKNETIDLLNMFRIEKDIRKKIKEVMQTYKVDFEPETLLLSIDKNELLSRMIDARVKEFWKEKMISMDVKYFYGVFLMLILSYNTYDPISKEFRQYFIDNQEVNDYMMSVFDRHKDSKNTIEDIARNLDNNMEEFISLIKRIGSLENILKDGNLLNNNVRDLAKLIDIMDKNNLSNLAEIIADKSLIRQLLFAVPRFFKVDLKDAKGVLFSDFSTGEKYLVRLVYGILYYTKHLARKDKIINLYIDEFESGLHPEWQKNIFNILQQTLKKVFHQTDIKINLLITTHSPFLLSDIPKQNVIFLDKDAEGKCIVVDGLKEKKQTFGANIHTLLSGSFFMEDGLMGEFAKGKIDKAIKLLNQESLSDDELKYCEQIISIIGEPIVKNQLQRMLDSKRLKKIDEIDAIKLSMTQMQQRLDELEK